MPDRRRVVLLGSTGSIGRQTVDVLAAHPDAFQAVALAGGRDREVLAEQAARLGVEARDTVAGGDADALQALATRDDVDLVVVATGGIVSLRPVLAALAAGKVVATANKETLVAGGHLVMPEARRLAADAATRAPGDPFASPLAWLRPIDSEHSALWQCLVGESPASIAALILTASGGPFLDASLDELATVTPDQALRHPTWTMGAKITIDSATLANKGLEVIEAHWLYDVDYDAIEVVIHPQSVVHSAVRFIDGSLKAQLGTPDMHLPIQYAMTYPDRRPSSAAAPDLIASARLDFRAPDVERFPALRIAREAGIAGPTASAALIAADDVAVERFLAGTLDFMGIPRLLEAAVSRFGGSDADAPGRRGTRGARCRGPRGLRHGADRDRGMTGFIQTLITIVLFFGILGILVVIHEIGHFVTARMANVRVLEFGVGFPPRAKVLRNKGETLYTLNWLPIGGFVKLEGEDGDEANDPRSFSAQGLPTKLLILVAGVAMNVALAFVIFTGIALLGDPTLGVKVEEVQPDSPAETAGLVAGDTIVTLDGEYYNAFEQTSILLAVREMAGETVELGVIRADGTEETLTVTIRDQAAIDAEQGALGLTEWSGTTTPVKVEYTVPEAVAVGAERTVWALGVIVGGLGELVEAIVTAPTEPPPVQGPVGIAQSIGDVFWQLGPDRDVVRGRDPVRQPGRGQRPAVPAARRRADAHDHPQAALRGSDQPPGRAADLHGRVRVPVRLPHLGDRVRHPARPERRHLGRSVASPDQLRILRPMRSSERARPSEGS